MQNTGILVHGDNHFIVAGPRPDRATAIALVRHWSLIQIGGATPEHLRSWRILARAFREDLSWAILVPGESAMNPAVEQLLRELTERGVALLDSVQDSW